MLKPSSETLQLSNCAAQCDSCLQDNGLVLAWVLHSVALQSTVMAPLLIAVSHTAVLL